jgi:putative oxidoreductase
VPLRCIVGIGFIVHGWAKLTRGPARFALLLSRIGVPAPGITAWLATFVELLGGAAVLIGAFVTAASVPLIAMMLVAMFKIHLQYGFSSINTVGLGSDGPRFGPPGYEVNLLYVASLVVLILSGAGAVSFDAWRARRLNLSGKTGARPWVGSDQRTGA